MVVKTTNKIKMGTLELRIENLENKIEKIERLANITFKDVLNINEVSLYTGISKSAIYKCTMNGTIPHYKQSKHLFFDKSEMIEWLKSNKLDKL